MSIYRKIDCRIWNDEKFRRLGDDGQFAFLFVVTHPAMTCLGAMRASLGGLAEERRWKPRRFRDAIADAMHFGMVEVNESAAFVGVPNFLKYNAPEGPNSVSKAWIRALDMIPECPERRALIHRCRVHLDQKSESFKGCLGPSVWDAFPLCTRDAIPDAIEHATPIQEQEQEQEQKTGAESSSMAEPAAAAWQLGIPSWVERELRGMGLSKRSAKLLVSQVGVHGLAPALAKLGSKKVSNPVGLLMRKGVELAEEGRAMLQKNLQSALMKAPGAFEGSWLALPEDIRLDPEIGASWCLWWALDRARVPESPEVNPEEQAARGRLIGLLLARHPSGEVIRARCNEAVQGVHPVIRERAWEGAVLTAFGLKRSA